MFSCLESSGESSDDEVLKKNPKLKPIAKPTTKSTIKPTINNNTPKIPQNEYVESDTHSDTGSEEIDETGCTFGSSDNFNIQNKTKLQTKIQRKKDKRNNAKQLSVSEPVRQPAQQVQQPIQKPVNVINTNAEDSKKLKKENEKSKKKDKSLPKENNNNKHYVTLFSDKVELTVGGKKLVNESNVVINSETKYFLLGNNGSGKTTLMKHLYEKLKDKDILMIDQDVKIESTEQSIKDFILCAHAELYDKHKQMMALEEVEEMTDEQHELYESLSEYVFTQGWDKYEAKSFQILNGLGFKDPEKKVSLLSGGWRMRLALGRALLYEPNALFLDESNNHLDLNAGIWLINYLQTYQKTIIMITHQIGFINALAQYIWWIGDPECTGTKIYSVTGQYHNLLQFIDQTKKEVTQKYDKLQKKIAEMRKKTVTKAEIEEVIKKANAPRPPKEYNVTITFEDVNCGQLGMRNIIEFKDVSFRYDGTSYNILSAVDYSINLKSRHVIVGENGAGKTTLFKLCTQQIEPTSGEIIKDSRITVGHYHQLTVDNLPMDMTAIEYMQSLNEHLSEDQCRARLGRIGLRKIDNLDIPKNKIRDLSGGQKARLAFSIIQLWSPSIILLDEPTNNLDITSIEALITAINQFNGAIIIITHDTHLIESIENYELYEVAEGFVKKFPGDFDEYKEKILGF